MYVTRTREQIDAANKYHTWIRGWRDGATGRAKRPDHANHPTLGTTYNEAYMAGIHAAGAMSTEAAKRFGHVPSILRGGETNGTSDEKKEGEGQ